MHRLQMILMLLPGSMVLAQESSDLRHCDQPIGTLAVHELPDSASAALGRYSLSSPTSLIRMMAQQSNCFIVVDRGVGLQDMGVERRLADSGELQSGSNVGPGQMKAADFILKPDVLISDNNSGGVGAIAGGILHHTVLAGLGAGVRFKSAETSMLVTDTRTGVQVLSAVGKAKKADFGLGMLGIGAGVGGAGGAYTQTSEGKVIAASFLNNFNQIATAAQSQSASLRPGTNTVGGDIVKAGAVFNEGDVLVPKIDGVRILAAPAADAKPVATVNETTAMVFLGDQKDGYLHVQAPATEGWIKQSLVAKRPKPH